MSIDNGAGSARYWAFISYSHKDARFGKKLHKRLESYLVPRRLVGKTARSGVVPRKLAPVFRDRDELPAARDLSTEVRAALQASRSLIVVCSPAAAASAWVGREVEAFRALHPDRPVLAAICQGEPDQSMPQALRRVDASGLIAEPLAADFRRDGDGFHLGLLKLVAGILGLRLDELVQRDSQRHVQRVTAVTAAALAGMLAMGTLAAYALFARAEAERQRSEAESLVEFMLTDLRDRLRGVGRLDVMATVDARALHYYSDQDLNHLPVDSLERRARILHAMGEDDEMRGDDNVALAEFHEAERTTSALLAQSPNDPERIFDQAQSEYWIGFANFQHQRYAAAKRAFLAYKRFADRMVAIAPQNPKYRQEVGYADTNLCALALKPPIDKAAAVAYCADALLQTERATRGQKATTDTAEALVERHAWLADAYFAEGDYNRASSERAIEADLLDALIAKDPKNMDLKASWVALQIALAEIEHALGEKQAAIEKLQTAADVAVAMEKFDPKNTDWRDQREFIAQEIAKWQRNSQTERRTRQ